MCIVKEVNMAKKAKPFVKWIGGKTQLLSEINMILPKELIQTNFTYVEPFVGGGAVLFHMLCNYPNMKKIVINDVNLDLINTYKTIANNHKELILILKELEREFHDLEEDEENKQIYYYDKRTLYNSKTENKLNQSALFIFLNKTCFNGLYRVNQKGEFNTPIGRYKKPTICDDANICVVNEILQNVEILNGDFEQTLKYANPNSLFYFDPPYKPINESSNFTEYTKGGFNDSEQIRLRDFCIKLHKLGHTWILSNSDVKKQYESNSFFDDLYKDFTIKRVLAKRTINANANRRGNVSELLITNQTREQLNERGEYEF